MTGTSVSLLLAVLGATSVLTSWTVPAGSDVARPAWLRAVGAWLLSGAAALHLALRATGDAPLRPLIQ